MHQVTYQNKSQFSSRHDSVRSLARFDWNPDLLSNPESWDDVADISDNINLTTRAIGEGQDVLLEHELSSLGEVIFDVLLEVGLEEGLGQSLMSIVMTSVIVETDHEWIAKSSFDRLLVGYSESISV